MVETVEILILAVTQANSATGDLCIAGIDRDGKWIRPLGNNGRFWTQPAASMGGRLVETGDIWSITGFFVTDSSYPNHVEDFFLSEPAQYQRKATQQNLLGFLETHQESINGLDQTLIGTGKSLCLYHVDEINITVSPYNKMKVSLPGISNPHTKDGQFPLKCLKSIGLYKAGLFQSIPSYICIGKAIPWAERDNIEFSMVIGIHNAQTEAITLGYPHINV